MRKKSKNKKKRKIPRPPLSFRDKAIYFLVMALFIVLLIFFAFAYQDIQSAIAYRDPSVVAYTDHLSSILGFLFILYTMLGGISIAEAYENKIPIFGNSQISYGREPWPKDFFPLLDPRRKTVYVSPAKKSVRRFLIKSWFTVFFLLLILSPLGLSGRDCLCRDNSIPRYNAVNNQIRSYGEEDFSQLTLWAGFRPGYRTPGHWRYEIAIEMTDGKEIRFSNADFNRNGANNNDISLEKMLEIKDLFSKEDITIKGKEDVDKVADHIGLNERQAQMLRNLFDL